MLPGNRSMVLGLSAVGLLGITTLGAAPSKAATCTFAQLLEGPTGSCPVLTAGDKDLTGFNRNSGIRVLPFPFATNGFQNSDTVTFTDTGTGAFDLTFNFLPSPIINRQRINASFTLDITEPVFVFDTVSITRAPSALFTGARATLTPGPVVTSSSIPAFFGPSSATFNTAVTSTSVNLELLSATPLSAIDSVTLRFTQKTPGPLAILGTGTAFALSRRIRRRVNQSART